MSGNPHAHRLTRILNSTAESTPFRSDTTSGSSCDISHPEEPRNTDYQISVSQVLTCPRSTASFESPIRSGERAWYAYTRKPSPSHLDSVFCIFPYRRTRLIKHATSSNNQ
ncbi:hypothetical protein SeMB42_g05178 [Synchytrium endobioticum]|uniref:Uncharacterized protein n=1 Tax=Synchytrium endobioticum TaxID=286115 RepID=A0A507CT49_9FUNG|nr:hypothetical protein SeMB42_g05178 [Synchytrium endobioticum]